MNSYVLALTFLLNRVWAACVAFLWHVEGGGAATTHLLKGDDSFPGLG